MWTEPSACELIRLGGGYNVAYTPAYLSVIPFRSCPIRGVQGGAVVSVGRRSSLRVVYACALVGDRL